MGRGENRIHVIPGEEVLVILVGGAAVLGGDLLSPGPIGVGDGNDPGLLRGGGLGEDRLALPSHADPGDADLLVRGHSAIPGEDG